MLIRSLVIIDFPTRFCLGFWLVYLIVYIRWPVVVFLVFFSGISCSFSSNVFRDFFAGLSPHSFM